jgi:hypothetical protein
MILALLRRGFGESIITPHHLIDVMRDLGEVTQAIQNE